MTATRSSFTVTKGWPELYGFSIYGEGPSYVVLVEAASIAEAAGLRVGDRIIELDSKDVSKQSSEAIRHIAAKSKNVPPPISVQSFCQQAELAANASFPSLAKTNRFGLTVRGEMPIVVDSVADNSPAFLAGIRKGYFFFHFV